MSISGAKDIKEIDTNAYNYLELQELNCIYQSLNAQDWSDKKLTMKQKC